MTKTKKIEIEPAMRFRDKDPRHNERIVTVIEKAPGSDKWVCVSNTTGRKTAIHERTLRDKFSPVVGT